MLLDELNEEKTIQNVNTLLENYDRLKRIAHSSLDLKSPKFDDMPKAQSIKNPSEEKIVRRLQAKQEFDAINKSIENLPGEHGRYRYILKQLYIYRTRPVEKIYRELHIEKDAYSKLKREALLAFAESFLIEDLLDWSPKTEIEQKSDRI
ncbi:ArpU family phage packaging/lysis transcriptional regulator [Liquorilactobacillus satsumensis]|uniref:ArpU family transcriptional regulator n=1 Tax=Liquorilactobacillus satsumensis DSM 16230 = JCM 12392 TaxID=1423801 RepID=A0A0R1UW39_9LACO|nr:ArpU family phage packaging/lysis transcriptional regulator [Liquorilactobacillus satsumensis]KRL97453.1 hypothetical protein FD50_GL001434 [Liquorilactobacillus satsumensis DSM 16230 = JCM 12392]